MDMNFEEEPHLDVPESAMEKVTPENPWLGRVGLVALSTVLSSAISAATVSIGWKASIDTLNAVNQVKLANTEADIDRLKMEAVKVSDLVYRDQLIDAKLNTINIEISGLHDQIEMQSGNRNRREP